MAVSVWEEGIIQIDLNIKQKTPTESEKKSKITDQKWIKTSKSSVEK